MIQDKKYQTNIELIRQIKPTLEQPERLTAGIMEAIDKSADSTGIKVLLWLRPLLAAASAFLIGLYAYQSQEKEFQPVSPASTYSVPLKSVALSEKGCIATDISFDQPKEIFMQYLHCERREEASQQQIKENLINDRLSRHPYLLKVN